MVAMYEQMWDTPYSFIPISSAIGVIAFITIVIIIGWQDCRLFHEVVPTDDVIRRILTRGL
jgi:hypothetical protein